MMTLDQFIARLNELRAVHGGNLPVVYESLFGLVSPFPETDIAVMDVKQPNEEIDASRCVAIGTSGLQKFSDIPECEFDDLLRLNDLAIREVLQRTKYEVLIVAMKGASDALKQRVVDNLSKSAAQLFKEDFADKGPVRISIVEAAQNEIALTIDKLYAEGQISFDC